MIVRFGDWVTSENRIWDAMSLSDSENVTINCSVPHFPQLQNGQDDASECNGHLGGEDKSSNVHMMHWGEEGRGVPR